ncbi:MAG: DUF1289 domain-containing protein [Porticoccaceae bacterium]|jgi:predicted Fe-S protein YdhL (DUF1289 family)
MVAAEPPALSPCISVCALNDEDICIGCFRSAREITQWRTLTTVERRQVITLAKERSRQNNPFA